MKAKIFAVSVFVLVLILVSINTYFLTNSIDDVISGIEELNIETGGEKEILKNGEELFDDFKKLETYISLTVSHNDLMSIEDSFSEFVGYLSVGDIDGAQVTKSRLINALEHLRRLSGINIDSII